MPSRSRSYASFPNTPWSLVARAGSADMATKRRALADLLGRYAPAIRSYLRFAKGIQPHDADDLLQGFLASKVLEEGIIARAEQSRGRFRSFLLQSLNNYIISEWRQTHAQIRGGKNRSASLDLESGLRAKSPDPAEIFDIAWARELLAESVRRMREECRQKKRPELWGLFQHRVLAEIRDEPDRLSYDALVSRYNLQSPAQATNLLMTAKRMFARTLTVVIAEYESEDAVQDEIRELTAILSKH